MKTLNKLKIIFPFLLILYSCNTNKEPYWVTNPPPDDDLFIYVVGFSEDGDTTNSVIEQLGDRYGFDSVYIPMVLKHKMDGGSSEDVTYIDEWVSDIGTYRLVRVRRSYIEPIVKMFVDELESSINYLSDFESSADVYFQDGEFFKAYELYLRALDSMVNEYSDFYIPALMRTTEKILNIVLPISFSDIETIDKLKVGESLFDKESDQVKSRFYFNIVGLEGSYDGFPFYSTINQGWDKKEVSTLVPIIGNSFEFIPPVPKVSGGYSFNAGLDLSDLISTLSTYDGSLNSYFANVVEKLNSLSKSTAVYYQYFAVSDMQSKAKLVSFKPIIAGEGVVRRLLEDETLVELASFQRDEESLEFYIRELNKATNGKFYYLVFCDEIESEALAYDGDILYKLTGNIDIYEIDNYTIVHSQRVSSEFIITPGEEDLAFLDFGLKVGEVISSLEF